MDLKQPQTTRHLENAQAMARGEAPDPPIAKLIGFATTHAELGHTVMELDADARHANPMGTLHGGVICDMADAAMGLALWTTLEDDETFTTLDMTVNFFKPIWKSHLRASGRVIRRTRTIGFIECEVLDEKDSLVAKLFSTCMVLRGEKAAGR